MNKNNVLAIGLTQKSRFLWVFVSGEQIWREGHRYAKAGVMLTELQSEVPSQLSLLQTVDVDRRTKLWRTVDQVNREFGRESV
jgi:hypothetical protein